MKQSKVKCGSGANTTLDQAGVNNTRQKENNYRMV
jgi:hypothetical protein